MVVSYPTTALLLVYSYYRDATVSESFCDFIVQENLPEGDITPARHALRTQVLRINNETQLSIKRSNFIHGKYLQC